MSLFDERWEVGERQIKTLGGGMLTRWMINAKSLPHNVAWDVSSEKVARYICDLHNQSLAGRLKEKE